MSDVTQQCNPNLSTPSADAAETGARVHLESASRPSFLPGTPESRPQEINTLRQWVGWKAEYRPNKSQKKPWSKVPKHPQTGRNASPTASRTWGAFDQAMASRIVVDRSIQLILPTYDNETEGLSRQVHVIPARGGLTHG